ncbi:hypothetical protein [Neobacillus mesonae]|uniref:hypothetical protein n=1 Tax=Neobacillus mesonae TaxID=1193713 RepID=UPI00203E183B|nr:hypothetical protein [Neobacillus mesonae]MCM3569802.1 hypothetical protein [Neobacillus mesonae]
MGKTGFVNWLENTTKLSSYSIRRYANAIDTLSDELGNYGLHEINLYHDVPEMVIDNILKNPAFLEKNKRGNNMYSAALNHYKNYIKYKNNLKPKD